MRKLQSVSSLQPFDEQIEGLTCRHEIFSIKDAVRYAVNGSIDLPEFQRDFVWEPDQVSDLADSLWRGYPIGMLLLWERFGERLNSLSPTFLIADGQQRLSSLSTLFGKNPYWRGNRPIPYQVWFDPFAVELPFFTSREIPFVSPGSHVVSTASLLGMGLDGESNDAERTKQLAHDLMARSNFNEMDAATIQARFDRLLSIPRQSIAAAIVSHPRNDVMEIFTRLNGHGIRFRRLLLRTAMKATRGLWNPPMLWRGPRI